jgi:hypothetical protein
MYEYDQTRIDDDGVILGFVLLENMSLSVVVITQVLLDPKFNFLLYVLTCVSYPKHVFIGIN